MCRFIYKLGQHFFIYHSWFTSNFETTYKKPSLIKAALFLWCSLNIILSWLPKRSNKNTVILYDRYYLQNCKAITFQKSHLQSHFHIFWLNFDKTNHNFLHFFLLLGEIDFRKNASWGNEWFPSSYGVMTRIWGRVLSGKGHTEKCLESMQFLGMWTL